MNVSDLQYMAMVRLDVSMWSGRARLREEDLNLPPGVELPPEALATLGSKKLFDPAKLRIFNTLKNRAANMLSKQGVKFLGGWATHEDRLQGIAAELAAIAHEFDAARAEFMNNYDTGLYDWMAQYPEWEHIIRRAVPTYSEVARKFSFNWQMFKITEHNLGHSYHGNNLHKSVTGIHNVLYEEVASDIEACWRECFEGKEKVTRKAFRPVKTLLGKVKGLTFMHSHINGLVAILESALDMAENAPDDPNRVAMFRAFLAGLSTPEAIENVCREYMSAQVEIDDIFTPFWDKANSETYGTQPNPVVADDDIVEQAKQVLEQFEEEDEEEEGEEQTVIKPSVFESNGLW